MLGNLLDNACKWARREVTLTVELPPSTSRARNRRLSITVADDGPGLTDEQRARIGKRGLRLDETKPGSGLGLSIVMELVHSYGGTCELAQRPAGRPGGAPEPAGGLNCSTSRFAQSGRLSATAGAHCLARPAHCGPQAEVQRRP